MNIFYLDRDPIAAAQQHCDKHVVKMVLETAQLLSTAHWLQGEAGYAERHGLYKPTHAKHPSAIWVRDCAGNYDWTFALLCALCDEYRHRYGRQHATERLLMPLSEVPAKLDYRGRFVPPPQCMPEEFKRPDAVSAYRAYYQGAKAAFARWTKRTTPDWFLAPA
jgi:hypothetical protein